MSDSLFNKDLCETSPEGDFVICPLCSGDSISRHLAEAAIAMQAENERLKLEVERLRSNQ